MHSISRRKGLFCPTVVSMHYSAALELSSSVRACGYLCSSKIHAHRPKSLGYLLAICQYSEWVVTALHCLCYTLSEKIIPSSQLDCQSLVLVLILFHEFYNET
jgi:hypothetical protein